MSELEHWIRFDRANDCIAVQPCVHGDQACTGGGGHKHGRRGVDMRWYVRGPCGVVQFVVSTGWMLDASDAIVGHDPRPVDLGWHSLSNPGDHATRLSCNLLEQGFCFYDGSSLAADEPWRLLREEGSDAVWGFLMTASTTRPSKYMMADTTAVDAIARHFTAETRARLTDNLHEPAVAKAVDASHRALCDRRLETWARELHNALEAANNATGGRR